METDVTYGKVATELLEIIKYLEKDLKNKLPTKLEEELSEVANKEYEFKIDKTRSLKDQKLLPETREILSGLYIKYMHPEEEQEILEIYKQNEIKREEEKREKYNPDNIFKNRQKITITENTECTQMIEVKEVRWYKKIVNSIKNFFNCLLGK